MFPKSKTKIAATMGVSENKAPGVSKALKPSLRQGNTKSLVSDQGKHKYPGAAITARAASNATVTGALDNLLFPDDVDCQFPAPIGTSNLYVASSALAGSKLTLPNYTNSTDFQSYTVQTGDVRTPIFQTNGGTYVYSADSSSITVQNSGPQWGIIRNTDDSNSTSNPVSQAILNDWNSHLAQPVWPVDIVTTADVGTFQSTWANPVAGDFTVNMVSADGLYTLSGTCDYSGVVVLSPLNSTQVWYFGITMGRDLSTPGEILVKITDVSISDARSAPISPLNLGLIGFSNFPYVQSRSDKVRLNCQEIVMTSTIPELYNGGNIVCGKIVGNIPPSNVGSSGVYQSWDDFLYAQKKHYLSNLKHGLAAMWFPEYNEWILNSKVINNPFTQDTVVNVIKVTYTNQSAISSLSVQTKINGWIDYTTNDTTIPTTPGIVFIDDWLTSISILEAYYCFTDNPTHKKLKTMLKDAVTWIRSGDPRAQALRKAGLTALKTAMGAAFAIL